MKKKGLLSIILVLAILATTITIGIADSRNNNVSAAVLPDKQELNVNIYQEPYTLDFQAASTSGETQIYSWIMEGLTRSYNGGKIKAGIAEKWDVSADGRTWTFHLRDAKWTDGKAVTANDFTYGWFRAIDPASPTDYGYLMYDIVGAEEYNNGLLTADKVGIKALDGKTIEVTLKNPTPYFDQLVSMPVFAPCRKDLVEKYGENYNTEVQNIVSNGPFKIATWEHETRMIFVKNPDYWNASAIKLNRILGWMISDNNTELSLYEAGILDHTVALGANQKAAVTKEQVKSYSDGTVWFLDYNCNDNILKNKNIRKALTYAIDRNEFIKSTNTPWKPAMSFVQPEFILDYDGKTFGEKATAIFKDNDVETAKKLLKQGMQELKISKLPVLKLLVNDASNVQSYGYILQKMWKDKLDIDVVIETAPSSIRLERQQNHDFQISLAGWGADYNDAMTYLEIYHSDSWNNDPGYSNPQYDKLIELAKVEVDNKKRSELLHQAEKLLMDDMPIGPIYFRYREYAVKEYVKNFYRNAIGADIDLIYSYISGKK